LLIILSFVLPTEMTLALYPVPRKEKNQEGVRLKASYAPVLLPSWKAAQFFLIPCCNAR